MTPEEWERIIRWFAAAPPLLDNAFYRLHIIGPHQPHQEEWNANPAPLEHTGDESDSFLPPQDVDADAIRMRKLRKEGK